MARVRTRYDDPDRIARRLFTLTVLGAIAFGTLIMALMHFSTARLPNEGPSVRPLVQVVR